MNATNLIFDDICHLFNNVTIIVPLLIPPDPNSTLLITLIPNISTNRIVDFYIDLFITITKIVFLLIPPDHNPTLLISSIVVYINKSHHRF